MTIQILVSGAMGFNPLPRRHAEIFPENTMEMPRAGESRLMRNGLDGVVARKKPRLGQLKPFVENLFVDKYKWIAEYCYDCPITTDSNGISAPLS